MDLQVVESLDYHPTPAPDPVVVITRWGTSDFPTFFLMNMFLNSFRVSENLNPSCPVGDVIIPAHSLSFSSSSLQFSL